MAVDAHGMPLRVLVTEGTRADCAEAGTLIEGLVAAHLIADKGYDSTAIIQQAQRQGMEAVIPPMLLVLNFRKNLAFLVGVGVF